METVTDFIFLGSKITVDSYCSHEIKRRLLLGRKSMTKLDSVLNSRDNTWPQGPCVKPQRWAEDRKVPQLCCQVLVPCWSSYLFLWPCLCQSTRSLLSYPKNLLCSTHILLHQQSSSHRSFYLHSFIFSKTSCGWNHTMCSLFTQGCGSSPK